jgi:hypothetical protein
MSSTLIIFTTMTAIRSAVLHIAAVEASYQTPTLGFDGFKRGDSEELRIALDLGERTRRKIKGHGVDYYLKIGPIENAGRVRQKRRRMGR